MPAGPGYRHGVRTGTLIAFAAVVALLAAACAVAGPGTGSAAPGPTFGESPVDSGAPGGSAAPASPPASYDPAELRFSMNGWRTDFSTYSVDLREFLGGGPPKDGIPAIDAPKFESIEQAREWLTDQGPVVSVAVGDQARAYPIAILIWHEIVNDTVGGQPVVITFCPLCNTALVFDRTVNGTVSDFGTTGNLRFSDLVMYDRQTESWWQQATGEAVVGTLTGTRLRFLPAQMISLADFATAYPAGDVLSRDTGYGRAYGANPYVGYDEAGRQPFLFDGEEDPRLPPKERVVTLDLGTDPVAFPYTELAKVGVAQTTVAGEEIAVFWVPGTASPLDSREISGRDIGATGVFRPVANGQALTFRRDGGPDAPIIDAETGSTWSVTGVATAGALAGMQLEPVVHGDHFWFAWAAFDPQTRIWTAP